MSNENSARIARAWTVHGGKNEKLKLPCVPRHGASLRDSSSAASCAAVGCGGGQSSRQASSLSSPSESVHLTPPIVAFGSGGGGGGDGGRGGGGGGGGGDGGHGGGGGGGHSVEARRASRPKNEIRSDVFRRPHSRATPALESRRLSALHDPGGSSRALLIAVRPSLGAVLCRPLRPPCGFFLPRRLGSSLVPPTLSRAAPVTPCLAHFLSHVSGLWPQSNLSLTALLPPAVCVHSQKPLRPLSILVLHAASCVASRGPLALH